MNFNTGDGAWYSTHAPSQFLWFKGDDGALYFAPPSHLHGHYDPATDALVIRCGDDAITVKGPGIAELVQCLGTGSAQGIHANGEELTSVVIETELDADAERVQLQTGATADA